MLNSGISKGQEMIFYLMHHATKLGMHTKTLFFVSFARGTKSQWASKENIECQCKDIMPQVCKRRVNKPDMQLQLCSTQNSQSRLQLTTTCHVVFPRGPRIISNVTLANISMSISFTRHSRFMESAFSVSPLGQMFRWVEIHLHAQSVSLWKQEDRKGSESTKSDNVWCYALPHMK